MFGSRRSMLVSFGARISEEVKQGNEAFQNAIQQLNVINQSVALAIKSSHFDDCFFHIRGKQSNE